MGTKNFTILIITALTSIILLNSSCERGVFGIRGEGDVVSETFLIHDFTGIELSIDADVIISNDGTDEIVIEGQQNIIDNIELDVDNGVWEIKNNRNVTRHEPVTIRINMDQLDKIYLTGSGDITCKSAYSGNYLEVKTTGSGNIFFNDNLEFSDLDLSITGSGNIDILGDFIDTKAQLTGTGHLFIEGISNKLIISTTGNGQFNGVDLECDDVQITSSGFGDCKVFVNSKLDVIITGSGNIYYKGNPDINANITGTGTVINMN